MDLLASTQLIISQFSSKEKLQLALLFISTTINGLIQALGIVSVMPLIALLTDPSLADSNQHFLLIKEFIPAQLHDSLLLVLGGLAFTLLLISNAFIVFDYWLTLKFFNVKEFKLSVKLFQQYMSQSYLDFKKNRISDMTRNVVQEVDRVIVGTLLALVGLVSDFIIAIAIIALLVYVNIWVTLIASLLIAMMYSLVYWLVIRKIEKLGEEFSQQESKIFAAIRQSLEFFREIRVSRKSQFFMRKYTQPAKAITRNATRYNILKLVPEQIIEVFAFGLVIFIAIYFSSQSEASALVISSVAFFAFAVYRLIPIVKDLFDGVEELKYLNTSLQEIVHEFEHTTRQVKNNTSSPLPFSNSIQLQRLSYRYPNTEKVVLDEVSFTISANKFSCIVGSSGVGKSTLLDLMIGLLKPSKGQILIDDTPLTAENMRGWLTQVGYVPQSIQLFEASVAENIAFGVAVKEIDYQRVTQVTKLVDIDEFIMNELAEQYHTKIGDSGVVLSGGQKQRIGIARSLYHSPKVLLLDEATNELDLKTEKKVLDSLVSLSQLTIIFVTHKPSIIDRAETVFDLDQVDPKDSGRIRTEDVD